MRHLGVLFLLFSIICSTAYAQSGDDSSIYQITDIAADVTADNAAHARDQAIAQAQRTGFIQLLQRLGADVNLATKLDDNAVADLVQAFEVQQEHTSSVRYIGTFTVQFKPNAIRDLLNKNGANFTETRSRPIVILPVVNNNGHMVLWEEQTKWRTAWEDASSNNGLVPIVIPTGDLDDIALLSAQEAIAGKPDAIRAIIDKYQAGGAIIALLQGNSDTASAELKVIAVRYDINGKGSDPSQWTLQAPPDFAQAIKQIKDTLETSWKQVTKAPKEPIERLPVVVPINTLADWAAIKRKLGNVSGINKTNVITVTRGNANIEIEFRGDITQLQASLAPQNLSLEQNNTTGAWTLISGRSP